MIGIYRITNKINGKSYIGKSKNLTRRIRDHWNRSANEKSNEYNSLIHRAIRKYGNDSFVVEIICECSEEELNSKEQYYIALYNTMVPYGYNVLAGGEGGFSTSYLFDKEDIEHIIEELKNTDKFYTEIAQEWDCSTELIKAIAYGTEYHMENVQYPVRTPEQMDRIRSKTGSFTSSNNPASKLNVEIIKDIVSDLLNTTLTTKEIAKKYNISVDQIQRINRGAIWKEVQRPIPCRDRKKELEQRVLLVADLLQNTKLSYSEILIESGYKDRHSIAKINTHSIYTELLKDYPNPIRQ